MARRTPRKLIALSSSAIAAIYMAGYLATSGADASLNVTPTPAVVAAAAAASPPANATRPALVPTPNFGGTAATVASATATSPSLAPSATATAPSAYRDGTYMGSGDSRRGGFTVAVTIQGGRIADVKIADAWTQYPVSRVAA